jgi:hypothetical protein
MAIYQLTNTGSIIRVADRATIPADPGNRDFQEYLAWLALAGNTPDGAPRDVSEADNTFTDTVWRF